MKGWKTWASVAGFVILGIIDISNGDYEQAIAKFAAAGGLVGIGHKVEKGQGK